MGTSGGIRSKDVSRILERNGYYRERCNKHIIFKKEGKRHIAIPLHMVNSMVWRRLVKENNLIIC